MRVYIVRHAIAVPRDAPGVADDASRELTPEGAEKWRRAVRGLVGMKIKLDRIFSSPLTRARQTADILAQAFPKAGAVRTARPLAPGGDPEQIMAVLAKDHLLEEIAIVGHEPDLSTVASLLISGVPSSDLELKKGGVACIEIENLTLPLRGTLLWLATPRQLRAMA